MSNKKIVKKKQIKTKAKGNRNEKKSIVMMEALGYRCTKSSASLGLWDFVGYNRHHWVCVQVKSNRNPAKMEMDILKEEEVPPNTSKLLHVWVDYARYPEVTEL